MMTANRLNRQPALLLLSIAAAQGMSTFVASNFSAISAYKRTLERTPRIALPQVRVAASTVFPYSFFRWKGWL